MQRIISIFAFIMPVLSCNFRAEYLTLDGFALGTTYHIVYQKTASVDAPVIVTQAIQEIVDLFSIYQNESVISKINRNETVEIDTLFIQVFNRGKEIYIQTQGAFDMTAAPYFDLFRRKEEVTQAKLDSIATYTGMDKIWLSDGKIIKSDPRVTLDANAIAKGFASDLIGSRLRDAGVINFLVEVGGEIYCYGINSKGTAWSIGIDRPEYGNFIPGRSFQAFLQISGRGLATSGNYRNYYEAEGQKYGHIVDPATGGPVQHSLLSATVLAPDCMTADALATAFMVMGLEKTKIFLESHTEIDVYLVYSDESGAFQSYATSNINII